jgi:hypothetical protein
MTQLVAPGRTRFPRVLAAALLIASPCLTEAAAKMCLPTAGAAGVPLVDGDPSDGAWSISPDAPHFGYEYMTATGTRLGRILAMRGGTPENVYLAFEAVRMSSPTLPPSDGLELLFDRGPNGYRRLSITVLGPDGDVVHPNYPYQVRVYDIPAGTAGPFHEEDWADGVTSQPASWRIYASRYTTFDENGDEKPTWAVEMAIPASELGLAPSRPDLGLFAEIFKQSPPEDVHPGANGYSDPLWWPTPEEGGETIYLDTVTLSNVYPAPAAWGTASLTSGCGLRFNWADVKTNHDGSAISLSSRNDFTAVVHNDGGTAKQVKATFKIANFGLQGEDFGAWDTIDAQLPAPNPNPNPTSPQDVPAGGTTTFTASWTLTDQQRAAYEAHRHQCVRVELEDGGPFSNVYLNRSVQRNMDFGNVASSWKRPIAINTRGWGAPAYGAAKHSIIVEAYPVVRLTKALGRSKIAEGKCVSELNWVFHGYIPAGKRVSIRGRAYEIRKRVGSFGFVVEHELDSPRSKLDPCDVVRGNRSTALKDWDLKVRGANSVRPNVWKVQVPPDASVTVTPSADIGCGQGPAGLTILALGALTPLLRRRRRR